MTKGRLEAFSDGVIAILITIMVLELKTPHTADLAALKQLAPVLSAYVVSFVYIGIYWTNHHHLLHATERVDGKILWANLHLLFWLSLIPFVTSWWDETEFAPLPTAIYGGVLLLAGVAYTLLQNLIIAAQGPNSKLKQAIGRDTKGKLSALLYLLAIPLALLVSPWIADGVYLLVALVWLVPDRRIERKLEGRPG
ncbi:TMEM175 family protein [Hyalangium versicolor]|uniref:TMEM175 family protein n=1 Tax=Hyalangium versicolor TaxID=2861190 RepID=UPI001CCAA035|nr:TMEM175 family protein [Hyalangium versicolor]